MVAEEEEEEEEKEEALIKEATMLPICRLCTT
jgi:hypothetical protein